MKKTPTETQEFLERVYRNARQLVIYRGILSDPIVSTLVELLDLLSRDGKHTRKTALRVAEAYAVFFSRLAAKASSSGSPGTGDVLQRHLLDLILSDENVFSEKVQSSDLLSVGKSLLRQVGLDLCRLQTLYHLDAAQLLSALRRFDDETEWSNWDQLVDVSAVVPSSAGEEVRQLFHEAPDWQALLPTLAGHYSEAGAGLFSRYRAFHWKHSLRESMIQPIEQPDGIRLEELIGHEDQKQWLVRNTSHFLAGLPANNIFVYGDRGTGKSSSIKALLNHFTDGLLRMIEVSRDDLGDLTEVMKLLRGRRERFIIFVDDLSFEEGETQYKTLKAVLEGSLESRPGNVLIYATSNRRHLIKEYFSDRNESGGEVRQQDTLQEKVSLADRFGIQLVFVAPDQNEYLSIIRAIACRRKLNIADDELKRRALQWVQLHNARSGRTARQFVDHLTAELQMQRLPALPSVGA